MKSYCMSERRSPEAGLAFAISENIARVFSWTTTEIYSASWERCAGLMALR